MMFAPLDRAVLVAEASAALEERWLPELIACWRQIAGVEGPAHTLRPAEIAQVAQAVHDLSSGLIREREAVGTDYMSDPAALGAYLLYFWPVSYVQSRVFLSQAQHATGRAAGRVLDVGAGPGPMSCAALDLGALSVNACERSEAALAALRALTAGRPDVHTRAFDLVRAPDMLPNGPFDTILLGHVLNELWHDAPDPVAARAAWVREVLAPKLAPEGVLIIIEPALRETSRAALGVRDALVAQGWSVAAPCLWAGACPALARPQDWCHAEHPWSPPTLVAEIAQVARLRKDTLKSTPLAMRLPGASAARMPDAGAQAPRVFQIVSEPLHAKGKQRHVGCGPEGRHTLTLLNKHVTEGNAAFEELTRGDVIALDTTTTKGDGLALGPDTALHVF
jgi:SAM-dependent methyltransferase